MMRTRGNIIVKTVGFAVSVVQTLILIAVNVEFV
jgi:hypothetical protein